MCIITYKNRILINRRKLTDVYYRSAADIENIKHWYIAIGLLYLSNQEKKTAKFTVQVCESKKSFAVAEVQKLQQTYRRLADLRTTYRYFAEFAVAE